MNDRSLKKDLTGNLLWAARQWRRAVDRKLKAHTMSEALVAPLIGIKCLGDGIHQNTLADHVGIEGPSLVRLLDRLEKQGLVWRRDDPGDRRAKGLWLTEQGHTLAALFEKELDLVRNEILKQVDASDILIALRVLHAFGRT